MKPCLTSNHNANDRSQVGTGSAPEILEPIRRQFGVAHRVLNIAVAKVGLQSACVVSLVRQCEAAGVAQHVRVRLELEAGRRASSLHKPRKACRGERRAALRREHEWRLGLLLALQPAKGAHFIAHDWMRARRSALGPTDRQRGPFEVDLVPTKVDQLRRSEAMAVGHQDHGRVAVAVPVILGGHRNILRTVATHIFRR